MALSEKFLEVGNLVEIAENGQDAINALYNFKDKNDSTPILNKIEEIITQLEHIIEQIQDETQDFLNRLGTSKAKFRKDVQTFYARKGVSHFYGPAVLNIIKGYQLGGDQDALNLNQFIVEYLKEASGQTIKAVIQDNKVKIVENVGSYAADQLIEGLVASMRGAGYSRIRSPKAIESVKNANELVVNSLSEGTRAGLLDMLKNPNKRVVLSVGGKDIDTQVLYNNIKNTEMTFNKGEVEMKIGFFWGRYMSTGEGYKTTDYFKYKKNSSGERKWKEGKREELEQFNRDLISQIAKVLRIKEAEDMMLYMADKDPMLFVVGNAGTKIIGILGEILAAIAIKKLLNNQVDSSVIIDWVANTRNQGKELSVDLVLKEVMGIDSGIQVKGSSKGAKEDLNISFGQGNFLDTIDKNGNILNPNIFTKMGIDEIIGRLQNQDSNISMLSIQEPLESHAFNVPYANAGLNRVQRVPIDFVYEDDPVAQANFRSFIGIYEKMADIANKIYLFFDIFMPDFLYMSKGADAENLLATLASQLQQTNTRGNIVYFFGSDVQFADDMLDMFKKDLNQLKELYEQDRVLSQQMHFTLATEFKQKNKKDLFMKDIVDYLNSNGKINLTSYKSVLTSSWQPFK